MEWVIAALFVPPTLALFWPIIGRWLDKIDERDNDRKFGD